MLANRRCFGIIKRTFGEAKKSVFNVKQQKTAMNGGEFGSKYANADKAIT